MPHIGVALRLQMVMADHHVVDVLNLEGLVIEAVLFALNAEEDAVVDKGLAGVCGGSSTTPISRITLASFTNILALPRPPILRTLINLDVKQMGARSARNPHAALRRGGGWKRGTAEILGHLQTKGRANRGNKLRPKPARQSSTLPMSGVWKRSYGRATKAPPNERGGNR